MIHINRPPAPDFLTAENNVWEIETQEAISHYSDKNQTEDFDFKRYNSPEIKEALREVFGTKCAYCETEYAANSDGDIEHFRPKGRVEGKTPDKPGYYWLANEWNNLLLSCMHCNQSRKHKIYDDTGLVLINDKKTKGKLDKFPLTDPSLRMKSPDDVIEDEDKLRLLINPCVEKPEEHFSYDAKFALIKPLSPMATESIIIYVLQRQYLVKKRRERLAYLLGSIEITKNALELYNATSLPMAKDLFDKALDNLINTFTLKESEYSGMCRFFVNKFLAQNNIITKKNIEKI